MGIRLDVVNVETGQGATALLAAMPVAFKHRLTPLKVLLQRAPAPIGDSDAALPIGCAFPGARSPVRALIVQEREQNRASPSRDAP